MFEFQKDLRRLKVDVTKNQDLLNDLIENLKHKNKRFDEMYHFDGSNLNVPVRTISDLNSLEDNQSQNLFLVLLINSNFRCLKMDYLDSCLIVLGTHYIQSSNTKCQKNYYTFLFIKIDTNIKPN